MNKLYKIEGPDLASIKKAMDSLHEQRNHLEYPIEIEIRGYRMGTICLNRDHLVWFWHGFQLATELIEKGTTQLQEALAAHHWGDRCICEQMKVIGLGPHEIVKR